MIGSALPVAMDVRYRGMSNIGGTESPRIELIYGKVLRPSTIRLGTNTTSERAERYTLFRMTVPVESHILEHMPAEVDIIVTSPDTTEVRLIAEAKLTLRDKRSAEDTLKKAMLRMSSPVGLLVTPERILVYLDQYVSQTPDSVTQVGDFDISHLLQFKPKSGSPDEARHFESVVQQFLEDLPRIASQVRLKDNEFWSVLNAYVLPAVETGQIRAAAPRYRS